MGGKTDGALQSASKRKAKAKPDVEPAKRITGVGVRNAPVVLDGEHVTASALEIGSGGAVIRVTERQAARLDKLGDGSL